ncbi:MAG: glycosyltransferase [Bacteriovoracaceae bacterium]|jgi:rhamnosyltransferase|nr:glycosyltransferase [Bacteriovoracaceae bacterium]
MQRQEIIKSIHGVLVLYRPSPTNVLGNIKTYIDFINHLTIVDNTEPEFNHHQQLFNSLDNCSYLNNHENKGIATALNQGAHQAILKGASWLLTMDEDSAFLPDPSKIIQYIESQNCDHLGILSPFHSVKDKCLIPEQEVQKKLTVMTSGNFLNLKAFSDIGPFNEDYFIDNVDFEFCLRLKNKGYNVFAINSCVLEHNLGDITNHIIFSAEANVTNHSPIRRYYITRNRLHLSFTMFFIFPFYCMNNIYSLFKENIKILFFEENKLKKIYFSFLGLRDFILGKKGKLSD